MLIKVLIIISLLLNPIVLLIGQPIFSSEIPLGEENQWEKWGSSLISAFLLANPNFLPIRDWNINEPEIEAKAALITAGNKILYQKNMDQVLTIASLTKLMTALIVLENINLKEIVVISEEAIAAYGDKGNLVVSEKISVENLLYALLMESSNDAAVSLAEAVEKKTDRNFVELMNEKAKRLELKNTHFADSSGYHSNNISTAQEISRLVTYSLNQPIIWQILKTPTINLSSTDGQINHYWVNTDELLNRLPNIIGGKTGYTEEAQGCLILVTQEPEENYLITVVLGAQEKFMETEKLINWFKQAYKW